jgi:hypothetical protein
LHGKSALLVIFVFVAIKKHHLDWLTKANLTFKQSHNTTLIYFTTTDNWWKIQNETSYLTKRDSSQLYKIQSGLAYKFKHFISDFGIQYFHRPHINYTSLDTTIPNEPINYQKPSYNAFNTFIDIGWHMTLNKLPSYITLGTYYHFLTQGYYENCRLNLKFGIDF